MADKTFTFKFTGDAKDLSRATGKVGDDMDGLGTRMGGSAKRIAAAVASAFVIDKVIDFGRELYNLGAQAELWQAKADIVFGDQIGLVETWAGGVAGSMGMTQTELVGLSASMGDLLVPMGATRGEAAEMSMGMGELSGALSAWSGGTRSATEVNEILASALLGERDSLKSLGISINQAEVDTRAMALAQADGRDEITQLDQAHATHQLILEKSTDAQTAWSDGTMDNVQKSNELSAQIGELKESLGSALLPVIQDVTAWIVDDMIPALQDFKEWIWPKVQAAAEGLSGWWDDNGPAIVDFATDVWDAVTEMGQGFMDAWNDDIKPAIDDLIDAVSGLWDEVSKYFGYIGGALDGLGIDWQFVGTIIGGAITIIIGMVTRMVDNIRLGFRIINGAISVGISVFNAVRTAIGWVRDQAVNFYNSVAPKMSSLGGIFRVAGSLISGAMNTARSAINALWWPVTSIYNALSALRNMFNAVRSALSIRLSIPTPRWPSPPSWMRSIGGWFHSGTHAVPGAPGANVPAMLQAGERVLSVAQGRQADRRASGSNGGINITVNAYGTTGREMVAEIERAVRDGARSGWLQSAGVI